MPASTLIVCITEGIPVLDTMKALALHEGQVVAPDRPELPGPHHGRTGQGRHHPGAHLHRGPRRHRVQERHADLRGDPPAHEARARPDDVHRHRRRSADRHDVHRRARTLRQGRPDRGRGDDRRDRRIGRAGSRRLDPGATSRSRSSASSPARRRLRAAAWATRARSSRAARARPTRRWPPCRPQA